MYKEFKEITDEFFKVLFPEMQNGWFVYGTSLSKSLFKRHPRLTLGEKAWQSNQVWFCPAIFKEPRSRSKKNVLGSWSLWIDIDDKTRLPPLPPTLLIETKNGYHAYYRLEKFLTNVKKIESLNKELSKISDGDECWDAPHLLRVPHTYHLKDPLDPYLVTIKSQSPLIYTAEIIKKLFTLPQECLDYMATGETKDRSKSDYVLISELLKLGIDEDFSKELWSHSSGNTKVIERGDKYVNNVFKRAKNNARTGVQRRGPRRQRPNQRHNNSPHTFIGGPNGTFMTTPTDTIHLCNFDAKLLSTVIPSEVNGELTYNIIATHRTTTYEITLSKSAFNSRRNLNSALNSTPLIWYEGDMNLAYYFEHLSTTSSKIITGVKSLGLHYHKDKPFYLLNDGILDFDLSWNNQNEGHTVLHGDETVLKGYAMNYNQKVERAYSEHLAALLPQINKPEISWALIGWFTSALYKPWLYRNNFKFPLLSFLGPAGSGKTTTINLLMRIFGNKNPQSIVADTTIFSVLTNLTATTTFPMNLSEVSNTTRVRSLRSLFLTLYDGARATRGRRDQTLSDYNLTTPLILDGNYLPLTDRAFIERTILLWAPSQERRTLHEESALKAIRNVLSDGQRGVFEICVEHVLKTLTTQANPLLSELKTLYAKLLTDNPRASERVIKNYAVIAFGALQFASAFNLEFPTTTLFNSLIEQTRGIGYADALSYFIEYVITAATKRSDMDILLNKELLGFRVNSMYHHFTQSIKVPPPNLSRDGIRLALQGASYYKGTKRVHGLTYHVIDLVKASSELNIPIDGLYQQLQPSQQQKRKPIDDS